MVALAEHSNVNGSACTMLINKGFRVWYDDERELYFAEKDGWDFCARTACGLLGLVAIYEFVEPTECSRAWWFVEDPQFQLSHEKPDYVPVWKRQ